jgi:hypothetical protein
MGVFGKLHRVCRTSVHEGVELTSSVLLACLPSLQEFGSKASTIDLHKPVENTVVICRVVLINGNAVAEESLPPLSFSQMVHSATSTSWQGPAVRSLSLCIFIVSKNCQMDLEGCKQQASLQYLRIVLTGCFAMLSMDLYHWLVPLLAVGRHPQLM